MSEILHFALILQKMNVIPILQVKTNSEMRIFALSWGILSPSMRFADRFVISDRIVTFPTLLLRKINITSSIRKLNQ